METAEVAITGIGMVTALGGDVQATLAGWRAGAAATRTRVPELAGTAYESTDVARLQALTVDGRVGNQRLLKYTAGAGLLGCLAAAEAMRDSGIAGKYAPERIGLYAGAGMSSAELSDGLPIITNSLDRDGRFSAALLGSRGLSATNPLMAFRILPNMAPCLVSMMEGIRGPSLIFTPWEGQTAAALIAAWEAVATGEVDCAVAGGADDPTNAANLVFLCSSGKLRSHEFAAPAAAYLVFERVDRARRDERRLYCRIPRMILHRTNSDVSDPLAARLGRTYAAAPAVLIALATVEPTIPVILNGVDRYEFRAELEPAA